MFKRSFLFAFVVSSFNVSAISLDDFSAQLVESHPYFVQLSLSEKTSLINQSRYLFIQIGILMLVQVRLILEVMIQLQDFTKTFTQLNTKLAQTEKFHIQAQLSI